MYPTDPADLMARHETEVQQYFSFFLFFFFFFFFWKAFFSIQWHCHHEKSWMTGSCSVDAVWEVSLHGSYQPTKAIVEKTVGDFHDDFERTATRTVILLPLTAAVLCLVCVQKKMTLPLCWQLWKSRSQQGQAGTVH